MTAWQAILFVLLLVTAEVAIVGIIRRRRRVSPEVQAQREALAAHVATYMQGYHRQPETANELVRWLESALQANPEQRMGQLIFNLTRDVNLFQVYDEEMLARLKKAANRDR